jgi:Flp pilus assembly protein TadB
VSPVTVIVIAFLVALPVMAGAFAGGAVIVALPVAVIGIATIALLDFNRRRKRARSMGELRDQAKAQRVDFTDRDRETLTPE